MAHFVLSYSDNLGETDDSIANLFKQLHEAAAQTKLFPLKGVRSRAYCCHQYRMADGNPQHGFAHLEVKLGSGRSMEERQVASEQFFAVFAKHFEPIQQQRGLALSYEMKELEPILKINKNNIAEYL